MLWNAGRNAYQTTRVNTVEGSDDETIPLSSSPTIDNDDNNNVAPPPTTTTTATLSTRINIDDLIASGSSMGLQSRVDRALEQQRRSRRRASPPTKFELDARDGRVPVETAALERYERDGWLGVSHECFVFT
jgi:hypothetical protein